MPDPWVPKDFPEAARAFVVLEWLLSDYLPAQGARIVSQGTEFAPNVASLEAVIRGDATLLHSFSMPLIDRPVN